MSDGKTFLCNLIIDGQLSVQVQPALSDTGAASKLNLDKSNLIFCREKGVTLSGKEIHV